MPGQARIIRRHWARALAVALLLIAGLDPAPLQAQDEARELYLLDMRADGRVLFESLPAYLSDTEDLSYLDFTLFLEAIEFPISRGESRWSGWFLRESRSYTWKMDAGVVEIAGRDPETVADTQWFEAEDGVYVATSLLESWFGLTLEVDHRQQELTLSSDQPLPFQLRQERTLARLRYRRAQEIEVDAFVPDQYNWATQPLFNVDSQVISRSDEGRRTTSMSTSIVAGMDLLKHSVIFSGGFTSGTDDATNPDDATRRLTLERFAETPQQPIFGNVHHYMFGDVYQGTPNLVLSPNTGRGFVINRHADSTTGGSSSVTITDNAPPGWEVELFRNGTLIDFATVGPDGRYFFPEQDIHFGENVFLIRLYGPQGQIREDERVFWGGGIELEPGDFDFSVSHVEYSETLLDGAPYNHESLVASYATDFRYLRALSKDAEIGASLTRTGLGTRERDGTYTADDYLSVFGRSRLGPGVLIGEVVSQQSDGRALGLEYLTGIPGHTLSFAHRLFDDYESPATLNGEALDAYTEISMLGSFGPGDRNGYRAGIRYRQLKSGDSDYRLFSRIGTRLGAVSLTNELEHRIYSGESSTLGRLRLAGRVAGMSIRGQVDYELGGRSPLRQVSVTMNRDYSRRINHNLSLSKNFGESGRTYLSNLVSLRIRDFDLSFGISSDFDRYRSFAAGINVAFGYDARQRKFMTDVQGLAQTGRVTMHLFVDENNNGLRDASEPPVAWASYREQETPASTPGTLTLTALPSATPVQIETRHFKFDDPFLAPSVDAYEVRTHAGSDIEIDVAIVMTGDIEGIIVAPDGTPLRGVTITLMDKLGNEVALARSEFDGYYSFSGIPSGDYQIGMSSKENAFEIMAQVTLDAARGYAIVGDIVLASVPATETLP